MMKTFIYAIVLGLCLCAASGQRCQGRFNESIVGQCESPTDCRGTLLAGVSCESKRCCINESTVPSRPTCLNHTAFLSVYNSTRGLFIAQLLDYGINRAGLCANCQAKAAYLAIAATMTENFEKDEATGNDASFAADDRRYGNTQAGDGSRFRRRGFFGLRGRGMYTRLQTLFAQYPVVDTPELAAIADNAVEIAAEISKNLNLADSTSSQSTTSTRATSVLQGTTLASYADGTFFSFSLLWFKLTGSIDQLSVATLHYSKFLRLLQCGGDLYPGQGSSCQYNATHVGVCIPDCIRGLEDGGEFCGCSGDPGAQCPNSPPHVRCCLGSCSQELKMDLGLLLDASGSISVPDYTLQKTFAENLLRRANVGANKTHVGVINFSDTLETLTWLNTDYDLDAKIQKVKRANHFQSGTNTALALQQANVVFSSARGLRPVEEGAAQVIFVVTDGESNDERQTLRAADVLKQKGIHLISVGVGTNLRESELVAMCTPPSSENYFRIADFSALDKKLDQFSSKTCSEPAVIPGNTTVTTEVSKNKYKFLKLKIVITGKKILIKVKLFNGKVKLFFSFKSKNPKDPEDFPDYNQPALTSFRSLWTELRDNIRHHTSSHNDLEEFVTVVVEKPDDDVDSVYAGIKGLEDENKFEVNLEDCELVDCRSAASTLALTFSLLFFVLFNLLHKEIC